MWIIEGKDCYHYYEKYKDPMTGKWKRVCVTRESKTRADQRAAQRLLNAKVDEAKTRYTEISLSRIRYSTANNCISLQNRCRELQITANHCKSLPHFCPTRKSPHRLR